MEATVTTTASPASQSLDVDLLTAAGTVAGVDISPDGKQVCFASSESGRARVYVMNVDGSDRRKLELGPEAATQPKWSPRGDCIAFLQDYGGDENYRVGLVNPATEEVR